MAPTVVLLSAYNGTRYIEQQIESIQRQSVSDWELIVRDDGSTDDTRALVSSIAERDSRISLLDDQRNVGPWSSFGLLLEECRSRQPDNVFLCDQDDVWLEDKIAMQLARLASIASSKGARHPALVHTDLTVVGEDLHTIHKSWHQYQKVHYNTADPLRTLLIHNGVVGCTIALNKALLDYALPIPERLYHDWWLAACAATFGTIEMIDQPTVLYRQHSTNVIGATHRHAFVRDLISNPGQFVSSYFDEFSIGVEQAAALAKRARRHDIDASRMDSYRDAFSPDESISSRIGSFRRSRAKTNRLLSRVMLYGIVAAYPAMRAGSGSSDGAGR
jgi:rhamnosyltransferase